MWRRRSIRSFFLGLLLVCVTGWAGSYAEQVPVVRYNNSRIDHLWMVWPYRGTLIAKWGGFFIYFPEGASLEWDRTFRLGDPRWFTLGFSFDWYREFGAGPQVGGDVGIPFWFPTALSVLALLFVWRKTAKWKTGGAFPVEAGNVPNTTGATAAKP